MAVDWSALELQEVDAHHIDAQLAQGFVLGDVDFNGVHRWPIMERLAPMRVLLDQRAIAGTRLEDPTEGPVFELGPRAFSQ